MLTPTRVVTVVLVEGAGAGLFEWRRPGLHRHRAPCAGRGIRRAARFAGAVLQTPAGGGARRRSVSASPSSSTATSSWWRRRPDCGFPSPRRDDTRGGKYSPLPQLAGLRRAADLSDLTLVQRPRGGRHRSRARRCPDELLHSEALETAHAAGRAAGPRAVAAKRLAKAGAADTVREALGRSAPSV